MPPWIVVLLVVIAVVAGAFLVLAHRVREVRRAGSPLLLRSLPAADDEGWRHGTVHYSGDALLFYRLSSLRPGPTTTLSRRRIHLGDRRRPFGTELVIMDENWVVADVTVGSGERSQRYELAMAPAVATAFQSWVEAAGPRRKRRSPNVS